ncbi:MAG: abortive infection family protein [Bacillota bacterium]
MAIKVFSKRHPEAAKEVSLRQAIRQRIWYVIEECDPYYYSNINWTMIWDGLPNRLMKEHGWKELRAYKSRDEWEKVDINDFILKGMPRFVLDAIELFYDLLLEDKARDYRSSADPTQYQSKLNVIFEDANLPWRMLDGRIIKVDSKWLEAEIHSKAAELLSIRGFEGALAEFQLARSDLLSGDCKGAIHAANLALESTIKAILGIEKEKPGMLIRKLIDSGLVPDYHEGFLKAFEEHILRSVSAVRNFEKGVGHGQGIDVNQPPKSLAELAVNLSGVLILYLLKRHQELHPVQVEMGGEPEVEDDDVPF